MCSYDLQSVLEAIDVLVDDWQLAVTAKIAGRISASVSSNKVAKSSTTWTEDQKKKHRSARVSILAYEAGSGLAPLFRFGKLLFVKFLERLSRSGSCKSDMEPKLDGLCREPLTNRQISGSFT